MKRTREAIQQEIRDYKSKIQVAKDELAAHKDTLKDLLPPYLYHVLVERTPRVLKSIKTRLEENVDTDSVAAGTAEINQDRWTCTVELEDGTWNEIELTKWTNDSWDEHGKPEEIRSFYPLDIGTWSDLLETTNGDVCKALLILAFETLMQDGPLATIKEIYADTDFADADASE